MKLTAQQKQLALYGGAAAVVLLFGPAISRWLVRQTVSTALAIPAEAIKGAAEAVGIPDTDPNLCEQYKSADDAWNASFYCPAGEFLKWYWWDRKSSTQRAVEALGPQPTDVPRVVVALPEEPQPYTPPEGEFYGA